MAKIIKLKAAASADKNIQALKILIEQYVPADHKKEAIQKIKKEQ